MIVGVPKEIKNKENRVSMVVAGVRALTQAGHKVLVQSTAGLGAGSSPSRRRFRDRWDRRAGKRS